MKNFIAHKKSIALSSLYLIFFGVLLFLSFKSQIQLVNISGLIFSADILLLSFSFLWFFTIKRKEKLWFLHLTVPFALNILTILFIFFCSVPWLCVIISLISTALIFLSYYSLEGGSNRRYLVNMSLFFAVLLLFFSAYSFVLSSLGLYWLGGILAVGLSSYFLYYELTSSFDDKSMRNFLVALFALMLFEFFIASLSWPIQSVFLKSLLMATFYYFYWGVSEKFLIGSDIKKDVVIYIAVLSLILLLVILTIFIKGI